MPTSADEMASRETAGFFDASRVNPARSLTLFAVGALVGLGIAGYSLFTAQGTSTRRVPPENVATVNQRPILRSDFITQLETETGSTFEESTRPQQIKVLDDMVREELLVQRALELDFAETDQDSRNALVTAVSQQILAQVTTSQPSEEQLQQYYDEHKTKYVTEGTLTTRNLVLPKVTGKDGQAAATARAAAEALRGGSSIDAVKQKYGLTEGAQYGEDFYFAARIHLGDTLFEQASKLDPGQVTEPLAADDGIHVLKVESNTRPVPLSYRRSRQQVFTDYKTDAQARLMEATLNFLRGRSKILIADDYSGDYKP